MASMQGTPGGARPWSWLVVALLSAWPAGFAGAAEVRVMALFKDKAVLLVDGRRRLLRAGQTSPEGVTLVAADADQATIEIDGVQRTQGLGGHISSTFTPPASRTVTIYPTPQGMYTVVGSINGLPVSFMVDTGATLVSMSAPHARRLGIDYLVEGRPAASQTAAGVSRVYLVNLDRVQVGDIALSNVPGAVHDGDFPREVLLGQSFLNRLDMRRDGSLLELKQEY